MDTQKLTKNIRWWYFWAILCFLPTLFFYYVGEEGVFTLNSMEMWQRQEFMSTVMYGFIGGGGGRPPLFNWLMIPVANAIGWEKVLIAARIVTLAATVSTSFITAWLAQQLWREPSISGLAGLLYLVTADVLLYRGWLSYADPLFGMFVVLSIALTWVACLRRSYSLLALAMLAAFAAFLTKALTAYVFLAIAILVLLPDTDTRRFLLKPRAWTIYALAVLLPLVWYKFGTHDTAQHSKMLEDIVEKLTPRDPVEYVTRLLVYPVDMFVRLMPTSLLVGYFLLRNRDVVWHQQGAVRTSLLIALLNVLPYWMAPHGGASYVLPVYPLLVLPAAWLVVKQSGVFAIRRWITGMLIAGTAMNFFAFPYYQKVVRGENYRRMAIEILERYGQYPVYATNVSSVGLAVVANIDSMRFDKAALVWPPADFRDGIVIAHSADDVPGKLLEKLHIDNDTVLLICRGAACNAGK